MMSVQKTKMLDWGARVPSAVCRGLTFEQVEQGRQSRATGAPSWDSSGHRPTAAGRARQGGRPRRLGDTRPLCGGRSLGNYRKFWVHTSWSNKPRAPFP